VLIGSLIASPLVVLLLFLYAAPYVGPKGALALVVSTLGFVLVAASASTMVAPLYAWDPRTTRERRNAWLTFARVCCSVLTIGILTLAIIAAVRLMTA
jgi:hypothetical protein